ncbi:hypothetical protein ACGFR6_08085 [Streptomyces sp. NPDC048567]|uniref:hypothetical protein n=1 Tax=Streptomyces sp. NPDC048567 TaxID=3365570 RepID=UPI0037201070
MQLTPLRRDLLRPAVWGAAALVAALSTGCSNSSPAPAPPPSMSPSVSAEPGNAQSAPAAEGGPEDDPEQDPQESPEPSPIISHAGRTKVVTVGDVEVRATRSELGFNVACNITNHRSSTLNLKVTVSIGDGKEWVRTTNFDFPNLAPGRTGKETTTVMGDFPGGESPDDPKIYIDSVIGY